MIKQQSIIHFISAVIYICILKIMLIQKSFYSVEHTHIERTLDPLALEPIDNRKSCGVHVSFDRVR